MPFHAYEHTFAVLSVTNKSSRAWVTCNCVRFLDTTNSGKARIAAAIPDDHVTMCACKPSVTLAHVVVYEIDARSWNKEKVDLLRIRDKMEQCLKL